MGDRNTNNDTDVKGEREKKGERIDRENVWKGKYRKKREDIEGEEEREESNKKHWKSDFNTHSHSPIFHG